MNLIVQYCLSMIMPCGYRVQFWQGKKVFMARQPLRVAGRSFPADNGAHLSKMEEAGIAATF
jgi:hypothetical protein